MRTDIVHIGAGELSYEIRNIVRVAEKLQAFGVEINPENIGDPVSKGETVPAWIKAIVSELAMQDSSYGYCATQGVPATREFLAGLNNRQGGAQITADDIIFFNGLGDAITKVYGFLKSTARVITPSPTYTTHSSSEASHAGMSPVYYPLDPRNQWYPDIDELRKRVKYNPSVAGLLIVNPDNPTGTVFPESVLREIVAIAEKFDLFIITDEIYHNLVFNGKKTKPLAAVLGDVPGLAMKGISKEFPWPGGRCGWIEIYNADKDRIFAQYVKSIINAKMVEVCSTTLPQQAIPKILEHPEYPAYIESRRRRYQKLSNLAYNRFKNIPGVFVNPADGAFYLSVVFQDEWLNKDQSLPISNPHARKLIEELTSQPGFQLDRRFVYYLLGATGICVVPLSSFNTKLQGFRMTLLEPNESKFKKMVDTLAMSMTSFMGSTENGLFHSDIVRVASSRAG